jgi:hypothetical protein
MWSIDVQNLVQNKFAICREYHIQPSEIDKMYMFEYEWLIDEIRKYNKQQEKQRKEDEKNNNFKMPNTSQMMSQAAASMPKVSIPKF